VDHKDSHQRPKTFQEDLTDEYVGDGMNMSVSCFDVCIVIGPLRDKPSQQSSIVQESKLM
jgi:hypothetical protein